MQRKNRRQWMPTLIEAQHILVDYFELLGGRGHVAGK